MASNRQRPGVAAIVAAALLPPLGMFLAEGISTGFWIAVALTCVGFVPGAVFALVMVLRRRPAL